MVWWKWSINENDMTKRNEESGMQNNCLGDANGLLLFTCTTNAHTQMNKTKSKIKHTRKYIYSLTNESTQWNK